MIIHQQVCPPWLGTYWACPTLVPSAAHTTQNSMQRYKPSAKRGHGNSKTYTWICLPQHLSRVISISSNQVRQVMLYCYCTGMAISTDLRCLTGRTDQHQWWCAAGGPPARGQSAHSHLDAPLAQMACTPHYTLNSYILLQPHMHILLAGRSL